MRKLEQNFKYFIILLIILILGILIFGNYNLNLSLVEGITEQLGNTVIAARTERLEKTYKHEKIGEDLTNFANDKYAACKNNHFDKKN